MSAALERRLERLEAGARPTLTHNQKSALEILRLSDLLFNDPDLTWTPNQVELANRAVHAFCPIAEIFSALALPPPQRWASARPHIARAAGVQ